MQLHCSINTGFNTIIPNSITTEFANFAMANGFNITNVIADGEIHRFDTSQYRRHDLAGWYVLQIKDGFAFGTIGDWRTGTTLYWHQNGINTSSPEFIKAKKLIDEERKQKEIENQAKAKIEAQRIFMEATNNDIPSDFPYIVRKKIQPAGMYGFNNGSIVLPIIDENCEIVSLQFINGDEHQNKKFLPFGKIKGCYTIIGDTPKASDYILLVEGWATGVSVYRSTGYPVVCAFNAGNLDAVSKTIKKLFPYNPIYIIADNDVKTHTGENYAQKTGLPYILIPTDPNNPDKSMDANDYVNAGFDLSELIRSKLKKRRIISIEEALACRKKTSWLVKNWLPRNSMMALFGPSGCGKTFVALDWLLAIASGQLDWNGCPVKKANILYLCGEGSYGLLKRVQGWKQHHHIDDIPNFMFMQESLNLNDINDLNILFSELDDLGFKPDVVCVDTFYRYFNGDENKAADTRAFFDNMNRIMAKYDGSSVLLIHHTGKADKTQLRGSTSIKAALDVSICCDKTGNIITLSQDKMKDFETIDEPLYLELQKVKIDGWKDDDDNPEETSVVVPSTKDKAKIAAKAESVKNKDDEGEILSLSETEISAFKNVVMSIAKQDATGKVFISKIEWRKYLRDQGMTPSQIDNYFRNNPTDPKQGARPINRLMANKYILRYESSSSIYVLGNTDITLDYLKNTVTNR